MTILGHCKEVPMSLPLCSDIQSDWVPILCLISAEKVGLSLSHLDSETLGPKVSLLFH